MCTLNLVENYLILANTIKVFTDSILAKDI